MVAQDATAKLANQAKTAATVETDVMESTDLEGTKATKATLASKVLPEFKAFVVPRETRATLVLKGLVDPQAFLDLVVKQEQTASTAFRHVNAYDEFHRN
jgi:hypothetical protein